MFAATAPVTASTGDPADLCEQASHQAARQSGVPLSVMRAISLTETGRRRDGEMRPWPWTVNMEGEGRWFDSADDAVEYAYRNYRRGARSFDVGCFQINFKWHGLHFTSIEQMFEPLANATYAARFLKQLYNELGNWSAAAGAYHSRTPRYANRYRARFETIRAGLDDAAPASVPAQVAEAASTPAVAPRVNTYPLLQRTGASNGMGSLVPLGGVSSGRRLVGRATALR